MDVEYVERLNPLLDVHILFLTIQKVLNRSDIVDVPGALQVPLNVHRSSSVRDEGSRKPHEYHR